MKKILVVMLALAMVVFVVGCGGGEEEATVSENEEVASEEAEEIPPFELNEIVHEWKDPEGYEFKATIRYTDWVNPENDSIYPTWGELCDFENLPDTEPSTWGIENGFSSTSSANNRGGFGFAGIEDYTDTHYCIGDVTIENVTKDWDITSSHPTSTVVEIDFYNSKEEDESDRVVLGGHIIGKTFSNAEEAQYDMRGLFKADMDSNKWGPYPFVFSHFDKRTPDDKDGQFYDEMNYSLQIVTHILGTTKESHTRPLDVIK